MNTAITTRRLTNDALGLTEAGEILRAGGLLAFPTETVYGLGADATNGIAVAGIYKAKGRPSFNPLIIHVSSLEEAKALARFDNEALALAKAFWPGPLTLVAPRLPECRISDLALAGLDSIAIRIPASPEARAVLAAAGRPIAAPSANRSGRVSPTTAEHVLEDLSGLIDAVVMGGQAEVGVESTIVACLDGKTVMLRPGGISRAAIEQALGYRLHDAPEVQDEGDAPRAPGMLLSHYAPRAMVRLNATDLQSGEAGLLFGPTGLKGSEQAAVTLNLSPRGDVVEAAVHLFGALRTLDASGVRSIAVAPVPEIGLGEAINDRLRRAAAPRG
jgi:L-threonylcarbamoyladenylate synthase